MNEKLEDAHTIAFDTTVMRKPRRGLLIVTLTPKEVDLISAGLKSALIYPLPKRQHEALYSLLARLT